MGVDVTQIVVTGLVTLVVGFALFHLQQGGRRGRLRREIREELELMALLGEESPVRKRIHARVAGLLDRYEPQQQPGASLTRWDWARLGVILVVGAGIMLTLLPDLRWWQSLGVGGAVGTVGAFIAASWETRREKQLDRLKLYEAD